MKKISFSSLNVCINIVPKAEDWIFRPNFEAGAYLLLASVIIFVFGVVLGIPHVMYGEFDWNMRLPEITCQLTVMSLVFMLIGLLVVLFSSVCSACKKDDRR